VTDTPPHIAERMAGLFSRRTPSERVIMACDMFDLARSLMIASVKAETPDINASDLRVKLFERLYPQDFEPAARARIVARVGQIGPTADGV
jgi:hypothetical protein